MDINGSPTLEKYKQEMKKYLWLYYPNATDAQMDDAIDYSIKKRMHNSKAKLSNSYKRYKVKARDPQTGNDVYVYQNLEQNVTLQQISDYIISRQPIVTAFGTMFAHHGEIPNPLCDVVQSFLDNRTKHKKQMFEYPKGSEDFEKYNLMQLLDKIDSNGVYGCLGQYTSLIYNPNVATSITSQGRAFVSSMTLHFEMFLNDNVKFGSLDQVLQYITNVITERQSRKFNDYEWLNHIPSTEECFAKIILDCGYRWIPDDRELDIIWKVLENLDQHDITRLYYKNNLFEFVSNVKVMSIIKKMLSDLETPFYTSSKVPEEIKEDLIFFKDLCMEFVYYRYMFIDRIDRCDNMIKAVTMVSDTDSTIISVDGWYRFILGNIQEEELKIANYTKDPVLDEEPKDLKPQKVKDFNFITEEIEEIEKMSNPDIILPNANVRYSIISILGYVLDNTVNDYMIKACENMNSVKDEFHPADACKIFSKSEFLFRRLMMVPRAKKNYASLIEMQEGNMVPEDEQLDIKGIEAMHKSTKPLKTRKALQKILLEDVMKAPVIDQLKFIKDIAILEHEIIDSIKNGSRDYYKPTTIKSMNSYDDPLRIQGIKASVAWNFMSKGTNLPAININERNGIDVIKVRIDRTTIERIKDLYPDIYANVLEALDDETFKTYVKDPKTGVKNKLSNNSIEAVALPLDVNLPKWLEPFIDYDSIISDNLAGFPYEAIGIQRLQRKNMVAANIVTL